MKDMAKKLSTAMLTALSIAYSRGKVLVGDDQRIAELGMAGRVSANTIYALRAARLLRSTKDSLGDELTIEGLRALGHAGVISADEYSATRRKWDEWMAVAHAEALEMAGAMQHDEPIDTPSLTVEREATHAEALNSADVRALVEARCNEIEEAAYDVRAEDLGPIEETDGRCAYGNVHDTETCIPCDTKDSKQRNLFVRHTRRGSETVVVERVHAGRVDYRVLDTKTQRVSAPYRMRERTFFDNYVPALVLS